jgi:hypothetical protein
MKMSDADCVQRYEIKLNACHLDLYKNIIDELNLKTGRVSLINTNSQVLLSYTLEKVFIAIRW